MTDRAYRMMYNVSPLVEPSHAECCATSRGVPGGQLGVIFQSKSGTMIKLDFWSLAPSRADIRLAQLRPRAGSMLDLDQRVGGTYPSISSSRR